MKLGAGIIAVVVVAAVAMLFVFGGDDPELSTQDQPTPAAAVTTPASSATRTPTATPSPRAGQHVVRIGESALRVTPKTVTRDGGTLFLAYENTTGESIEVVFAHGTPKGAKAIQREIVTGAVIQAGEQRRDGVRVEPGRYTGLLRSPEEDKPPADTVSVEVR